MARGGRRAGERTSYPNRTDLVRAHLPVYGLTGLPYGDRQNSDPQRAVPMGHSRSGTNSSHPWPAPGPPPSPGPAAGSLPFLGPTQRPNEPVTHGLPIGPGAGPEVLQNTPAQARQNVGQLLQQLAAAPGATSDVKELAADANSGTGLMLAPEEDSQPLTSSHNSKRPPRSGRRHQGCARAEIFARPGAWGGAVGWRCCRQRTVGYGCGAVKGY